MVLIFDERICVIRIYSDALENLMEPYFGEKIDLFSDFIIQYRTGIVDSFVRYWNNNSWADRILRKLAPDLFKDPQNTIGIALCEQLYHQLTTFITDKLHSALTCPVIPHEVIKSIQQHVNEHNYKPIIAIKPKEWRSITGIHELIESVTADLKREITTFINIERFIFQCKQTTHGIGVINADVPLYKLCDIIPPTTRFFIRQHYTFGTLKRVSLVYCVKNDSIGIAYRKELKWKDNRIPLYWKRIENVGCKAFELYHFDCDDIDTATAKLIRLVEGFIERSLSMAEKIVHQPESQIREIKIEPSKIIVSD